MSVYTMPALKKSGIEPGLCGEHPVLDVKNDFAEARVSLYGAQVLSFIPRGEQNVLWCSSKANFVRGKAIRGGIPVCWPWFGKGGTPFHGVARISLWKLEESLMEADGSTTIVLALDQRTEYNLFCYLTINVGSILSISLQTTNCGNHPFALTEALHSYFSVSDISQVSVLGLTENDLPENNRFFPGFRKGALIFRQETDLVCQPGKRILVIQDKGNGRRIRIKRGGSASAVIWNPWIEKAKRMEDYEDEEYHKMVCVEAANAGLGAKVLTPGSIHTLSTEISLF